MTAFIVKRVHEPPDADDGTRVLVDRLWPRGIARCKARIDVWLKDIAPSDALRKRFHGKGEVWEAFRVAYFGELEGPAAQAAARTVLELAHNGPVTLLYSARDEQHNNAVALSAWLERRRKGRATSS